MYFKVSLMNNTSRGVWSRRPAMHQESKVQFTSALLLWPWSSFQYRTCMTCPEIIVHNTIPFFLVFHLFFLTLNWPVYWWVYSLKFKLWLLDQPHWAARGHQSGVTRILPAWQALLRAGATRDKVSKTTQAEHSPRLQLWDQAPDKWKQNPWGVIYTSNMVEFVTSVTWLMLLVISSSHSFSVKKSFSSRSVRTLWRSKQAMAWKRKGREEHETLQGMC